jgi:hypothetical protein
MQSLKYFIAWIRCVPDPRFKEMVRRVGLQNSVIDASGRMFAVMSMLE